MKTTETVNFEADKNVVKTYSAGPDNQR